MLDALKKLVAQHPAWGYRKLWATLPRDGLSVDPRRVHHLRVYALCKAHDLLLAPERPIRPEPSRGNVAVSEPNRRTATALTTEWTDPNGLCALAILADRGNCWWHGQQVSESQEAPTILAPVPAALAEHFGAPSSAPLSSASVHGASDRRASRRHAVAQREPPSPLSRPHLIQHRHAGLAEEHDANRPGQSQRQHATGHCREPADDVPPIADAYRIGMELRRTDRHRPSEPSTLPPIVAPIYIYTQVGRAPHPQLCKRSDVTKTRNPATQCIALWTALTFLTSACTTVHAVRPTQLARLDGFVHRETSAVEAIKALGKEPTYALQDVDGRSHTFDGSTRLVLDTAVSGKTERREERYRSVVVRDGQFMGKTTDDGSDVQVPLTQIEMAGVRRRSIGKTALLVGGIATGPLVLLIIAGANAPESSGSDSDIDFD